MLFGPSVSQYGTDTVGKAPFELTAQQRRIRDAYNLRWAFYLGKQARYIDAPGEAQIVINFVRALVDKSNDFLFGSGYDFGGEPNLWPFFDPLVDEVWSGTDKEVFGYELGQMGAVTGDVFVKVWWDQEWEQVKFSVLNSSSVVPVWDNDRLSKDRRMAECRVVRVVEETTIEGTQEPDKVYYTTVYTPEMIIQYRNNNIVSSQENPIGEIPIVHIQNLPLSGSNEGLSDVEDIIKVQEEINTKISAISGIIDYHEQPTTLAYGITPQQLEKGVDNVWFLPSKTNGASVENLDLTSDLSAGNNFLQTMREFGYELSGVPEAILGKQQAISNTSGVALHMQYLPLIQRVDRKKATYGVGINELTRLGVKVLNVFNPQAFAIEIGPSVRNADNRIEQAFPIGTRLAVKVDNKDWKALRLKVGWKEVLPKDALMELEKIVQVRSMGLIPKRIALSNIVKSGVIDLDCSVTECLEEVEAENEMAMQQEYASAGMLGQIGANPNGSHSQNWTEQGSGEQSNRNPESDEGKTGE